VESDREISELVCGNQAEYLALFSPSLEECSALKIFSQKQALDYLGGKVRVTQRNSRVGIKPNWGDEARELLAKTVLAHVPVDLDKNGFYNFRPKAVYVALMIRRTLQATHSGGIVDDRDFVGNKRLEL
jgi:DNA-directed RNA polymerase III subunit RPC2